MANLDVRYILEWQNDGRVHRAYVLPRVADITIGLVPPDVRRFGLAGRPRKQHAQYRDIPISIRGRSGFKEQSGADAGGTRSGNGPDFFRELVAFLRDFQAYAAAHESAFRQDQQVQLVFRALWENEHHLVHLTRFDQHRDTDNSRFSYTWSAEFRTDGPADRTAAPNAAERGAERRERRRAAESESGLDRDTIDATAGTAITAGANGVADRLPVNEPGFADQVESFVEDATDFLKRVHAHLDGVRRPLQAAIRAATAVRGFAQGLREITVEFPRDLVLDLFQVLDTAAIAIFETWDALPAGARGTSRRNMLEALHNVQGLRGTTLEWLGERGERVGALVDRPNYLGGGPGVAIYQGALVAEHTVTLGQTLQDIAGEVLGDRSRWTEIAILNGMPNARELRDGSPLVAGGVLKVPAVAGEGVAINNIDVSNLYGVDFRFGNDRDLVAVGNPPVDVATVRGEALFEQALWMRASLLKGDNAVWPQAGIDRVVAQPIDRQAISHFAAHTREQFLRDDRVAAVESFRLEAEGTAISATFDAVPVTGGKVPLKVPMA